MGAVGSLFSADASSKMYTYQAGLADLKRKIDLQRADYFRASGEVSAQSSGLKSRAEIGATKAIQGARGVDVAGGSNALVRDSEREIGQQNQRIIRSNAAQRAWGADVEAATDEAQSAMYRRGAETSKTSGYINAASSILGGASSVADKWYQGNQAGLWSGAKNDELLIYGPGN